MLVRLDSARAFAAFPVALAAGPVYGPVEEKPRGTSAERASRSRRMTEAPSLVAIDWGTTRLRAYLLGDRGEVLDKVGVDEGIMAVPPGGFPATLRRHVGSWLERHAGIPVVLAGMVGSRNGWVEVPY